MKLRKKIAGVVSAILSVLLVLGNVQFQAMGQGAETTFTINITNNTGFSNGNVVSYKINNDGWAMVESSKVIDISGSDNITIKVEKAVADEVALDFTGSTGFDTDDFLGTTGDNGQRFDLKDGQSYTLNVIFNNANGGNNPDQGNPDNPNPDNPNPDNPNPPQEIKNPQDITVSVSEGADLLDIFGNYLTVDGINVNDGKVTVEKADTHRIGVLCMFGFSIDKAVINGKETEYVKNDGGWYYYDVADADSYDVKLYKGQNTYTIAWMNSGDLGDDAIVEHGRVEIASSEGIKDMGQEDGGLFAVEPGTMVTIRLIPDYGYQLKSTDLNGATVAAGAEVSTFTFEMPETNLHLAALFVKTDDQVDCTSSNVVDDVAIENGGNAVSSGNLKMTVEDNSTYATDVSSAVKAESVTKVASLDLTLDNIVSKGNDSYWTTNITEFTKPISVSLKLDTEALKDGETYSIVRDHNGTLTELDTKYEASTGTISFDTNQFSTYTIVKKTAVKEEPGKEDPEKEDPGKDEPEKDVSGKVENDTNADNNACNSELSESVSELTDKILTEAEKKRIENGESVKVYLNVADISSSVSDADKALIDAKKGDAKVGMYLDIDLLKKIGNDEPSNVTNTNGKVTISLNVPESLINKDSSVTRTYQIVRIHDNVATLIDCKFDSATGKISFGTDAFSTYALVYTDKTNTETANTNVDKITTITTEKNTAETSATPKTCDLSMAGLWVVVAVLSGAGLIILGRKKLYR